ncbi:MAG: YciI family protein [Baekduia sp.]
MKYMILIYDNAQSREQFHSEEGAALMAEVNAIMAEITESGEMIGGEALADPSNTKTIRLQGGVPVVTDGPLAEAKEHFGGYLLVECETPERAAEIARRWPSARFTPLEVRPLMSPDGAEM